MKLKPIFPLFLVLLICFGVANVSFSAEPLTKQVVVKSLASTTTPNFFSLFRNFLFEVVKKGDKRSGWIRALDDIELLPSTRARNLGLLNLMKEVSKDYKDANLRSWIAQLNLILNPG